MPKLALQQYLTTGNFSEVTFENWESEFLQMFLYVLAAIKLRQWGSSESKSLEKPEDVDMPPKPHKNAPWPVNKGGMILALYKNSLSLVFLALFLASFFLHAWGSYDNYADEQFRKGLSVQDAASYFEGPDFWFESFQNWQSEFLSIASIVVFSIFLRQQGSPESKPVDMPHAETP